MKKIFLITIIILFSALSAFSGEFEETLKAAEQGDINAQFLLGVMYHDGQGVRLDYNQAAFWLIKAAELGSSSAQHNIGIMYFKGQGITQDYNQAAYWITKSAEQGVAESQGILGLMYYNGEGVPKNFKLAYVWLYLASAQGLENANEIRNTIAEQLTPQQLTEAQELLDNMGR